ncbi:hypothetical protein VCR8J2_840088 [Vibrio coralliirubri]|nr:hypothetical protein VCR8J2_840088 [Vibrio coralliirubri]
MHLIFIHREMHPQILVPFNRFRLGLYEKTIQLSGESLHLDGFCNRTKTRGSHSYQYRQYRYRY